MDKTFQWESLQDFRKCLLQDEKSTATIDKYMHDLNVFGNFLGKRAITKELTLAYKMMLSQKYAITSANSMLAAMNAFLKYMGWQDCCVKQFRIQRKVYSSEEKELTRAEYQRLVRTAHRLGNQRLQLLLQTICGTGIRVSELEHITVEAAKKGEAVVSCKGKTRVILIVPELKKALLKYAGQQKIESGPIFITKYGKPMNRSNIWREMKSLCKQAGVSKDKVFPHNLRHLFARCYYELEKDIAKLADILGHTNINTTRIYIMTTGVEHRKKLENMRLII